MTASAGSSGRERQRLRCVCSLRSSNLLLLTETGLSSSTRGLLTGLRRHLVRTDRALKVASAALLAYIAARFVGRSALRSDVEPQGRRSPQARIEADAS